MHSQQNLAVVRFVHREIETALWAVGTALVFYFLIFVLPKLPETRIRVELLRIQEINAENEHLCQTLHMGPKEPMHDECILALGELRKDVENRFAYEHEF